MLKLLPICLLNQSTREDNFFHMFRNLRKIETLQNYFSRWNLKFSWKETKIVSKLFKWGMQELLNISLRWLENGPVEERKFFVEWTLQNIFTLFTPYIWKQIPYLVFVRQLVVHESVCLSCFSLCVFVSLQKSAMTFDLFDRIAQNLNLITLVHQLGLLSFNFY